MKRMYPWEKWFNGREHRLRPDIDFAISIPTMQIVICNAARRRGIEVSTRTWQGRLLVQADVLSKREAH